ncbi:MAG: ankyrin repeat domain-containing protein, partial [Vicinamibacterales bacterium]
MPVRQFPSRPNLDQLRHQAKDLLRALRNGDPAAIDDFRIHQSPGFDLAGATLADAQLVLARSYQASSWPELVLVCEVLDATAHDDVEALRDLLARHPHLTRDAWKDAASGWMPVVANAADLSLHRVIGMLQARGARGVAETRARPHLRKWLDMLRLLGRLGAHPPRDAVGGAVELLNGEDFAFMLEVGTDIEDWRPSVALALETYA